ncbi:MAG: serine/threonine-protein kinase, partial [Acidobacteriota bacterium]
MTEASEHGKGLKEAALGHPERIGPYHLLERIGEGGMGVVYVAEQTEPVRRRVALKLIKAGMDTREVIARFHSERQALALMNHPNIARILEAGATEGGRPFFVMEYVPGMPLLEYCDAQRLPLGQRLRLFVQICEAVQHAHQKGVIHRDLKPSNLLVKEEDGQPVPKVIDFGVAKAVAQRLSDLTVHTQLGGLIGTPEYISPEQARMTGLDVDTRADVYSLGAVLYELLTGSRPFDFLNPALGLAEVQAGILEQEPRSPSQRVTRGEHARDRAKARRSDVRQLARRLHHDLDWIVLKALEKDRNRRYASASELAADIEHYLEGRPVVAGPRSTRYRLARFVRRHRSLLALGSLAVALLIAGIIGTTLGLMRARKEAERARVQTDIAREVHSFLTQDLLSAVAP